MSYFLWQTYQCTELPRTLMLSNDRIFLCVYVTGAGNKGPLHSCPGVVPVSPEGCQRCDRPPGICSQRHSIKVCRQNYWVEVELSDKTHILYDCCFKCVSKKNNTDVFFLICNVLSIWIQFGSKWGIGAAIAVQLVKSTAGSCKWIHPWWTDLCGNASFPVLNSI